MTGQTHTKLIDDFYNHLPSIEGKHPYMYLDSEGYLTIGLGILLCKFDSSKTKELVKKLSESKEDLTLDKAFELKSEIIDPLYQESTISKALEEVQKLPFQIAFGERVKNPKTKRSSLKVDPQTSVIPTAKKSRLIKNAFDELFRKSIILKAQKAKAHKKKEKFGAYIAQSYFTCIKKNDLGTVLMECDGPTLIEILTDPTRTTSSFTNFLKACEVSYKNRESNFLVIPESKIKSLAENMIKEKIKQLQHYFPKKAALPGKSGDPGFDGYPASVQLALLDLSYNMGAGKLAATPASKGGYETLTKLVKQQKWQEIVDDEAYFRKQVSEERNDFVGDLFTTAAEAQKKAKEEAEKKAKAKGAAK